MRRTSIAAALTLLTVAVIVASPVTGRQEPDDPPPIKTIMGTLNKGPKALTSSIGRNLDRSSPDWRTLTELCKEYVDNVEYLGQHVPPRGEPASWERLTTQYLDQAKTLADAVKTQDRKAALAVHRKIKQACARCHIDHKP